jgi:hypothetical protein
MQETRGEAEPSHYQQRFATGGFAIGVWLEQPQHPKEAARFQSLPRISHRKPSP